MGDDSFILMNLKDSKEVAAAMQNDTAQKILDYLTKGKATESEISKALSIAMSTVHYNLQQLLKAKLVKADEYHYSKKGKEVLHYKLAKKLIIIAPGDDSGTWKNLLKKVIPAFGITAAVGLIFRTFANKTNYLVTQTDFGAKIAPAAMEMADAEAVGGMLRSAPQAMDGIEVASNAVSQPFWQQLSSFEWFILGSISVIAILLIMELIAQKQWFKLKKR